MSTAQPQRFELTTATGVTLAGYHWAARPDISPAAHTAVDDLRPAQPPARAPLIMVHGFGEHARRHAALARAAAAAGHDVYGFDQEGHGESPGRRAVVAGFASARAAVSALIAVAARAAGTGPVPGSSGGPVPGPAAADSRTNGPVLFGHSLGGLIALEYALDEPDQLAALLLSAPALQDAVKRPKWLVAVAGPIARLAPTLPVVKLDVNGISRDPAEVARYRTDPLIHHGGVPAVTGHTINSQGAELLGRAGSLRVPTLLVHGEADALMAVEGSRKLAATAPPGVVRLHAVPGAFHEMHHDPPASGVPAQVLALELAFLAEHGGLPGA